MSEQDNDNSDLAQILLEAPPTVGAGSNCSSVIGALMPSEALGITLGKLTALELFFKHVTSDLSFKDFIREILVAIIQTIPCEAGSIIEMDYKNNSLFFRSVIGHSSDQVLNFVIPLGHGIVGHVAEKRLPLIVNDLPENRVHLKAVAKAVGFETKNLVAFPLVVRGRVYGVLELLNRVGEPNFSSTDIETLNYLCQMAAKAIEIRFMISWSRNAGSSEASKKSA